MNATKYKSPAMGCYFDHSYCNVDELNRKTVGLALGWGWVLSEDDATKFNDEPDADDERSDGPDQEYSEFLNELADEAIDWLNEQETRSFMYWANSGEANAFGLWPNLECAKEDCEFVSSQRNEYPDEDYRGEWLHINERGNCTLYVRVNARMTPEGYDDEEVWSLV